MKKLTLLIALFSVIGLSAHAADPALMTKTQAMQKVQTMKKQFKPAISSKIKADMRTGKAETTEPETTEPETTEPTEPAGIYTLELGEVQLGADPTTCEITWAIDVTNTGTAVSPTGISLFPVIEHDAPEGHLAHNINMPYPAVSPIEAGQVQHFEGILIPSYAYTQDLVLTLKNETSALDSKRITLPAENEYTLVLGDLVTVGDQISIPLTNNGTASVLPLTLHFLGKMDGQPAFGIENNPLRCLLPGETHVFNFPVPTQDLNGYSAMVYRDGDRNALVSRRYPQ